MITFDPIIWTARLISVAVFLQTVELLQLRHTFSEEGVWRWSTIRKEFRAFPKVFAAILNFTLKTPNFNYLLGLRIICATSAFILIDPVSILVMLLATILICLRWRGVFNGGSDYMTIVVLGGLLVATLFKDNELVTAAALIYIAVQSCSSYFISGVVKIRKVNWRNGRALAAFLKSGIYPPPAWLVQQLRNNIFSRFASWGIIIFELLFPLVFTSPTAALLFICAALGFHLLNFYLFGLNRFLFAWLATYPAIFYSSQLFQL